ncbi:MAG: hypothetical protein ABEJ99_05275 [Candidatus Nanohaloarchaea archaeon]
MYAVSFKWVLGEGIYWNIFFWSRIGGLASVFLLLSSLETGKSAIETAKSFRQKKLHMLGLSELANSLNEFFKALALSLGPAALVQTVVGVEPLIVIILASLLGWFGLDLGDDLSRKTLSWKLLAIALTVIGIYLLSR